MPLNSQLGHYSCNLKLPRNERKATHIFVQNDVSHFQWSPMSLGGIPWRPVLGSWKSPKSRIITFNFSCFWDIFGLLRAQSYFSPETFVGVPTWVVTLRGCLAPFSNLEKPVKPNFVHFSRNLKLSQNEPKAIHIYIRSKGHESFRMSSHVPRRHSVASGARVPRKSESVYYNLLFWLFLRYFWISPSPLIFFSRNVPRSADVSCNIAGVLGTIFRCLEMPLNTQFVHYYSSNLKLHWNEPKAVHIFVPKDMTHFQWPPMYLGCISWRPELGSRESPKVCIITFNFGCFWNIFGFFRVRSYFSPEKFLGVPTWVVTWRGCLAPFFVASKSL